MKFIPILFSTAMVQELQAGTKTQTRRVVKTKFTNTDLVWRVDKHHSKGRLIELQNDLPAPVKNEDGSTTHHVRAFSEIKCPYGAPGDILWVRETYTVDSTDWENDFIVYKADLPNYPMGSSKWKPSIFMPRAACRLFLKIKSIRVERLQEISEEDAVAEGVEKYHDSSFYKMYGSNNDWCATPYASYAYLWESINGPESWEANPWVWVVEFERVDKPDNF